MKSKKHSTDQKMENKQGKLILYSINEKCTWRIIKSSERRIIGNNINEINKNLLFAEILYLSSKYPIKKKIIIEISRTIKS